MILDDVTVSGCREYARRRDFNGETNCVTSLYVDCLPKVRTAEIGKIIVQVCPSIGGKLKFEDMVDVFQVLEEFDFEEYWIKDAHDRKRAVLEVLQRGLLEVARHLSWEIAPFEEAYKKVQERQFVNEKFFTNYCPSADKVRSARLFWNYDLDRIDLWIVIYDSQQKEIGRIKVATTQPHEIWVAGLIGKLKWADNDTIALHSKDGKVRTFSFVAGGQHPLA